MRNAAVVLTAMIGIPIMAADWWIGAHQEALAAASLALFDFALPWPR